MKVIIEDLVKRMQGGKEEVLPKNTTIRFEMGDTHLRCKIEEERLEIYKVNSNGLEEDRIMTIGHASNIIYVL